MIVEISDPVTKVAHKQAIFVVGQTAPRRPGVAAGERNGYCSPAARATTATDVQITTEKLEPQVMEGELSEGRRTSNTWPESTGFRAIIVRLSRWWRIGIAGTPGQDALTNRFRSEVGRIRRRIDQYCPGRRRRVCFDRLRIYTGCGGEGRLHDSVRSDPLVDAGIISRNLTVHSAPESCIRNCLCDN